MIEAATPACEPETDMAAARDHARDVVRQSGTSFMWAMRLLPEHRRDAMFAIYAFCREVDDIADGDDERPAKETALADWRAEIDRLYAGEARSRTARALAGPVSAFKLEREAFLAIIDGMEMDAAERMRAPSWDELELYCARVAGAVGVLSVRVFGESGPAGREVALKLGEALQLTNILRDLHEDAGRGRLYLPREALEAAGITTLEPACVLSDPRLPEACAQVAARARTRFAEAEAALSRCSRRAMRPAIVMMKVYARILERLEARGWQRLAEPVHLSRLEKLAIALRYGLL